MSEEFLTLYKLMIMFMLDRLDFPLSNSQLSKFFVSREYASYFQLQQAISELVDSSFIREEVIRNTTSYHLCDTGREALELFEAKIPHAIKEDIMDYFAANKYQLRREVDITADYYPAKRGEYIVTARIKERGTTLLELNINVVSKEQAVAVCDSWPEKSEKIYAAVIETLLFKSD